MKVKFCCLLRLFALDLTVSAAARFTGLGIQVVNARYLRLRQRCRTWNPVPAELAGAVEFDEINFGPRRGRGIRGRGASSKIVVFDLLKRGGQVYPEIIHDCLKKTIQAIIRGKIDASGMVNTDD